VKYPWDMLREKEELEEDFGSEHSDPGTDDD
jgi:hypothetical protein